MKRSIIAAAFAVALAFAANAAAQTSIASSAPDPTASTSALYTALTDGLRISQGENLDVLPTMGSMLALGYIVGIRETLSVYGTVCVPAGIAADASERIVVKFVDGNPKSYGQPPLAVVAKAFIQAFPCRKR